MAIKVYGDKIVYPDNSEQTTAFTGEVNKDVYTKEEVDEQQEAQDVEIAKKINDAPEDDKTYARNNKTWVNISDSSGIPDAPVDGLQYGRQDGEWTEVTGGETPTDVYTKEQTDDLLDEKADKSTTYTKTEVDSSQSTQDDAIANNTIAIQANTDAIANLPTPVDTYTKAQIDAQQGLQDDAITANDTAIVTNTNNILTNSSNIAQNTADIVTNTASITTNTTNLGTLSSKVIENSEEIERLNEASYFSSGYTVGYPEKVNRPPLDGELYLQEDALFTYSYNDCNAIFMSNTDAMGNVREFTAIAVGDIISLNEIDSPNYGRYKVKIVTKNSGYTVILVDKVIAQGSVINGAKIAVQAFPASADSIWTNVGGVATTSLSTSINGSLTVGGDNTFTKDLFSNKLYLQEFEGDTNFSISVNGTSSVMEFKNAFSGFDFNQDITVNGVIKANRNDNYLNLNADYNQTGTQAVIESKLPLNFISPSLSYTNQNDANQQLALTWTDDKTLELYAKRATGGETQALNIRSNSDTNFVVNGETRMTLDDSGKVILSGGIGNFTTNKGGNGNSMGITVDDGDEVMFFTKDTVFSPAIWANKDVAGSKTVKIDSAGVMSVDTTTTYSAKEVDGLINAKDEIINKLTERLDALELKFKALK